AGPPRTVHARHDPGRSMKQFRWLSLFGVAIIAAGSMAARRPVYERIEIARIRAHLDSVLAELSAARPAGLTTEQAARRAALLAELRAYRDRGAFPHNYDFPGQLVPYFVDRKTGTPCAVADLMTFSGRRDVVDRVARTTNNARVADLRRDGA